MMDYNLKFPQNGEDNNSVNDKLSPTVKKSIREIAEAEGYVHYNTYEKMISSDGGNYLGVLYEIDIKDETAEGNIKETNIFVKQVLPQCDNIKIISMSEIYSREVFIYTDIAKIFGELQNKANIPTNKRFKLAKIYDENNFDAVILENMTKQGFKTYSRSEIMNLDYAKLCIENLAKFHGLAFAIERKMPEFFEQKIKTLKHPITIDAKTKTIVNIFYDLVIKKISSDRKVQIDKRWKTASDDYIKYLDGSKTDVKCLCHGDFKMNNIMYKINKGELEEVIAVDYQLTHYGSPVLDLMYFLFTGSDKKFRRMHMDDLKDHYYESLKKYLEHFNVSIDDFYPKKMFKNDFEDCLDFALVVSVWMLPLSLVSQDKDLVLDDCETLKSALKFNDTYYDRLNGIFDDVFKWD